MKAEKERLHGDQRERWLEWGTYVSERCWGTIREHPGSPDDAWEGFPFEHARSRAYRWSEDALAGWCDSRQRLVMAPAFWNGRDPILKERFFGLTNPQGLHGEELKDIFFHLDGTPTCSYMRLLYRYPQREFPYKKLVELAQEQDLDEKARQLRHLLQEDFRQGRYFDLTIEYAKAGPGDVLCRISTSNPGPEVAELHILAQLWFRRGQSGGLRLHQDQLEVQGADLDGCTLSVFTPPDEWWFCDNQTNQQLLFNRPNPSAYPKDGIDQAVVKGDFSLVNPQQRGTKAAAAWRKELQPGEHWQVCWRLSSSSPCELEPEQIFQLRRQEADEFYQDLAAQPLDQEQRMIQRQALAGLCFSQTFYHFHAQEWLQGDPELPDSRPPGGLDHEKWPEFEAHDLLPMPDVWEYPWLANWDMAFHLYTLQLMDRQRARQQVERLVSSRFTRPDGAIAGFEGSLTGPHPPVISWAAWSIYCEGGRDRDFLQAIYGPLARHYQWWLCNHQPEPFLFSGGFLGQDNAGPWSRNQLPEGSQLLQADGVGWVGCLLLHLFGMAVELGRDCEAAAYLADLQRLQKAAERLWCDRDRFYFDCLQEPDKEPRFVRARSFSGLVPLLAVMPIQKHLLQSLPLTAALLKDLPANDDGVSLISLVSPERFQELMKRVLDPEEFLSQFGIRSLSRYHKDQPLKFELNGETTTLQYEPGEGCTVIEGGNSNWRGPIWAPLNLRLIEAIHRYGEYLTKPCLQMEGEELCCAEVAERLSKRFTALFQRNHEGWRPAQGDSPDVRDTPLQFHEYFHAEEGRGLGASHQTGWTAVVARLIQDGARPKPLWPEPYNNRLFAAEPAISWP